MISSDMGAAQKKRENPKPLIAQLIGECIGETQSIVIDC